MAFIIKNIFYRNFKYVGNEGEQLELGKDLTLLDGPNGYGKSTVFDAIELLLTGKIAHSNKGKRISLANNSKADMVVKAFLEDDENKIELERTFSAVDEFEEDKITWNGVAISQEQLYEKLNLNESAMGVAIYVSQLKSLSYLEKKERDRRKVVANLVDDKGFEEEIECLGLFEKTLKDRIGKEVKGIQDKIKLESEKKEKLTVQINNINKIQGKKGYARLFADKDYEFDKKQLNKDIGYSEMIKPLEDIKEYLQNYDVFNNTKRYLRISKVLALNTVQLKAFFYNNVIQKIKENLKLYENIEKLERLIKDKNIDDISQINQILHIKEEDRKEIEAIVERHKFLKNTEKENEKCIYEIVEKRQQLHNTYENSVKGEVWEKNTCPFCGRDAEDLQTLFQNTEKAIKENNKLVVEDIQQLEIGVHQYFENRKNDVADMIKENKEEYAKYLEMKDLLSISINQDEKDVLKEKKFEYLVSEENSDFGKKVIQLKNELEEEKRNIGEILDKEQLIRYQNIAQEYYSETKLHTVKEIDDKIAYIAEYYSDSYQKALEECNESLGKLEQELEQKTKANEHMMLYTETYLDKYKKALNEYQTNLVQQIKIPLYVYSGKVIQNYPMGLGIIANIKSSSIVFETEKKEEDVFDYLSAGQLNGVMLSVMLAVRSVMDMQQSLNIIMIDDPLQTIDDVSAFSYADLLSEQFEDAQIVLSTHEIDKSDLLEFKFRQHDRMVKKYNMHNRYLGNK